MSYPQPKVVSYLAGAAIPRGSAVKIGADKKHVICGSANTSPCIGIALNAATAAEDTVEVALPGGGAMALLNETVSAGNDLVSHTDGKLALPNAEGDQLVARALEGGASGELVPVLVYLGTAHASQSAL